MSFGIAYIDPSDSEIALTAFIAQGEHLCEDCV
jgi:hypothetical protein